MDFSSQHLALSGSHMNYHGGGGDSHVVQSLFMQNHQLHQTLQHEKIARLQRDVEYLSRQHQANQQQLVMMSQQQQMAAQQQQMGMQMPMSPGAQMCQIPMPPRQPGVMMPAAQMGPPKSADPLMNQLFEEHLNCKKEHEGIMASTNGEDQRHQSRKAIHAKFVKLRDQVRKLKGAPEKKKAPCLGVIRLDYNYPPGEGDTDCPASFGYDVKFRVIPGFTFEMAQSGKFTDEVERNFAEGVKWLEHQKVSAITGDCGFMMAFQVQARKIASVPVFMSSMVQCPIIACAFDPGDQFLILTANDASLKPQKDVLLSSCGFTVDDDRFIIIGCQDVPGFDAVAKGLKVPIDIVQPGIVKKTMAYIKSHPAIRGILLECTELPPYADALRASTGLPVWDAITGADFYINAYKDNPRFGVNDWCKEWEGVKEYTFGENLIAADKRDLVSKGDPKVAAKAKAKTKALKNVKKLKKQQAPTLGVVRLDYNYPPSAGDIDAPGSFDYDVLFKMVPGLSFEMCQAGNMPPAVEEEFKNAIKWLEKRGCCAITGDCGFMMAFQPLARKTATVPCFMSSMVQCPMVSVAFDKYDKILILTANSATLKPQKDAMLNHCGFDVDETRFVIAGCQDIPGFDAVSKAEKVDVELVTPGMVKLVDGILQQQPSIRSILLECTELPPYADALRQSTGLPVWDAITCCDFFVSARKDNPRFGLNQWQNDWDQDFSGYDEGLSNVQRNLVHGAGW